MRNIDACLYVRPSDQTTLAAIETWLTERNAKPKPFKWTAKANIILEKNARARRALEEDLAAGTKSNQSEH